VRGVFLNDYKSRSYKLSFSKKSNEDEPRTIIKIEPNSSDSEGVAYIMPVMITI